MRKVVFVLALVAAAVSPGALTGPDGRDYARIVVASNAPDSVKLAADELKRFLGKTGIADLPVAHEAATSSADAKSATCASASSTHVRGPAVPAPDA